MADIDEYTLLLPSKRVSQATYVDVNPLPYAGSTELLIDGPAILASVRNLIKCFRGSRSRVFQEDYFCGLYELLQEPFDDITGTKMSISLYQALSKWEPRVNWAPADIRISRDTVNVAYNISLNFNLDNGDSVSHSFSLSRSTA